MAIMMYSAIELLDLFARGGGGGSSGGSGGGGGGVYALIILAGYIPSYFLGKFIKRLLGRKAELIVSGAFAVLASLIIMIVGAGGGFYGEFVAILVVVGVWTGWTAAFFGIWDRLKKRADLAKLKIGKASQTDSMWDATKMQVFAENTFMQFQKDWSDMNVTNMQTYLTPRYAYHNGLMIKTLQELGRKNIMENIKINNCLIIDAVDNVDNTKDSFVVAFGASALDIIIENSGQKLFADSSKFTEYWNFVRNNDKWYLDSITQNTQNLASKNASIYEFATRNNMFYSLDMGWLFLPTRGVIFSKGGMGKSDINNHVVGLYHERLVQFYTYTNTVNRNDTENLLIMQVSLPKSYGGIVVRPDGGRLHSLFGNIAPKGYTKYEFEWPDFNRRYDVHATDADRLAAFELINPSFMAYLYDNDPGVGIEVVDNIVYLYKKLGVRTTTIVDAADYEKMMNIALRAYKELKL